MDKKASKKASMEYELRKAGLFDKDSGYGGMLGDAVMELMDVFISQKHSGFSGNMTASIFKKLVEGLPLTPLTGEDDEWIKVDEKLFQNNRCSYVFKGEGGAYNIRGRVFVDPDGMPFISKHSRVDIVFPYTPTTEYVYSVDIVLESGGNKP